MKVWEGPTLVYHPKADVVQTSDLEYNYFFLIYFGLVSMSPQHAHSWVAELQYQNRGHIDTRLYPYNVLNVLHYTPCLKFLPVSPTSPVILLTSPLTRPLPLPPAPLNPLGLSPTVPTIYEKPRPQAYAPSYCRVP